MLFYGTITKFIISLILLSGLLNSSILETIEKIVINNAYIHCSQGSTKPKEAVSLHVFDVLTNETVKYHVPGCTCKIFQDSEPPVFFPKTWTVGHSKASFLFPLVDIDSMGRTIFYLWDKDIEDFLLPHTIKSNTEKQENHGETFSEFSRRRWQGNYLYFMSSMEFAATRLNQDRLHLWYALSGEELLLHVPLSSENGTSNRWMVGDSPPYFGWARCFPAKVPRGQTGIPFLSVHPSDGTTPLFGVRVAEKEVYLEGEKRRFDHAFDWLVQFKRQDGTCFWRSLDAGNSWKDVDLENGKTPKTVIVNNDSNYIYISSDLSVDSKDVPKSLSAIADGLRERKLLKDYLPREPSDRMKKKLEEAEEKGKLQAHILELRKQAEEERLKQASEGVSPVGGQPPGIPRLLTADEARKMLDGGAEFVFTEEELKELLAEPDPSKFKSSVELGLAYDWVGKFAEAKAELEKDQTPLGRFELGRFLMAGRPGMPADRDRANSILEKLVNEMEEREDKLTAAECLLAGKACHEIRPRKSTQWAHWVELGDEFFQQAIDLGEKAGHYYIQHYRRMKPEKKLDEIWKALPTDDIEARAGLAGYAGHMQQFRKHRDQEHHLQDLKTAVQARCNRAQYWLGLLYSMGVGEPGKYLKHNNEKARFWLKRAAERGDWEAQFLLSTLPKQ